jgi:hypothetical protein
MILVRKQDAEGVWMKYSLDFIRKKCISHILALRPGPQPEYYPSSTTTTPISPFARDFKITPKVSFTHS